VRSVTRVIISLVRHARAGSRKAWSQPDIERPLDPKGRDQASAICALLRTRDIGRIVSSPALRCQQTVGPLVHLRRLPLELHEALAEGAPVALALALIDECVAGGHDAVLCSHGDVIPAVLDALAAAGVDVPAPRERKKGSIWDLHVRDGRIERAGYTASALGATDAG
jgi:phosphohistidine phosphatase SixA